jgi:peptidoglycan-associated lipoprotein
VTGIGTTTDAIETHVGILNATTMTGGIFIGEADAITLGNVTAGAGNVVIGNNTGDMTIHTVMATAGGVDLTTTSGSILDGNGAVNNITAAADSSLRAFGGVIGLGSDPIEVNIRSGSLGVAAVNQIGNISAIINGTVSPSNTLAVLNAPPGQVIFNGNVLYPQSNLPLGGIGAALNTGLDNSPFDVGAFVRNSNTLILSNLARCYSGATLAGEETMPCEPEAVIVFLEPTMPADVMTELAGGVEIDSGDENTTGRESGMVMLTFPSLSASVTEESFVERTEEGEKRIRDEQIAVAGKGEAHEDHAKKEQRIQNEQIVTAMTSPDEVRRQAAVDGGTNPVETGRQTRAGITSNTDDAPYLSTEIMQQAQARDAAVLNNDILFEFEKWGLSDATIQALMEVAEWLKANPKKRLLIEGHCDERGSLAYNLLLGEKRARAVQNILVTLGVNEKQMNVVSYGKERPIYNESNESCYQQNRRGHFVLHVP